MTTWPRLLRRHPSESNPPQGAPERDATMRSVEAALRLTPDSLRRATFSDALRGYSKPEVDQLLEVLARQLASASFELAASHAEIARLRARDRDLQDVYRKFNRDPDLPPDKAVVVVYAESEARRLVARAQILADERTNQLQAHAAALMATAWRRYEEILIRARDQAQRAVADAVHAFTQVTQTRLQGALENFGIDLNHAVGLPAPPDAPGTAAELTPSTRQL